MPETQLEKYLIELLDTNEIDKEINELQKHKKEIKKLKARIAKELEVNAK